MCGSTVRGEPTQLPVRGTVVVGVDGSGPSKHALLWAQFLAHATDSIIEAVAAWQPYTSYGAMGAGLAAIPPDWDLRKDSQTALTATINEVFSDHRPVGMRLTVCEGNAARVLVEASRNAQLLVVGSRGHGGFAGLLLGSVSAACAEHAECPVVILRGNTPPPDVPRDDLVSHASPHAPRNG